MALVQWCCCFAFFFGSAISRRSLKFLSGNSSGSKSVQWSCEMFICLAYRPGRTPVGCGRGSRLILNGIRFDS